MSLSDRDRLIPAAEWKAKHAKAAAPATQVSRKEDNPTEVIRMACQLAGLPDEDFRGFLARGLTPADAMKEISVLQGRETLAERMMAGKHRG